MAGRLASVPESIRSHHAASPLPFHQTPNSSTTGITAPFSPCDSYRESIRSVVWPRWITRSTLPSLSGQSESSYSSGSSALSSYLSNSSGLGSASAGELTKIAHKMVSEGYTQRMVQEFGDGVGQDRALHNWFVELDVDWVLRICGGYGIPRHLELELLFGNTSASWRRELIEKWVRALTIIVASIKDELVAAVQQETSAVAQLGKASISALLVFVEAILDDFEVENLQPVLHMYICVSRASHDWPAMHLLSWEAQIILNKIVTSLEGEENRLAQAISSRMLNTRTLFAHSLLREKMSQGGGKVHREIQMLMECILLLKNARASTQMSAQSHNTENLRLLMDEMIGYTKELLLKKSKLCLDLNLRYLFLLNNSYFVAQMSEPSISLHVGLRAGLHHQGLELTPECEQYMCSYLDGSWGHVLSCIPKPNYLREPKHRKKSSSLSKFQSAFHKTYHSQKFWKVPDPQLRSLLRESITKRVISGYRDYLKEHPEVEKQVSSGSNSPEVLEEMLGELFEG